MARPGPLRLTPVRLPKVWAAPALPQPWSGLLDAPEATGEVWLASSRHHVTPAAGGPAHGLGLDQITARWPRWITGDPQATDFPILLKLLNVGQWLSVQVHPNDQDARRLENEPWGKSEAWHVLAAEDGAEIIHGLTPGVGAAEVARKVEQGGLTEVLARVGAKAGDTFHLPAGTVHSTGPGLFIFEIQQASDVTYRFYDWDRPGDDGRLRPLHQAQALKVMDVSGPGGPTAPRMLSDAPHARTLLVSDPHFSLISGRLEGQAALARKPAAARVIFVLSGAGRLSWGAGESQAINPAETWLIPAGLEECGLASVDGPLEYLEASSAPATA